MCVYVCEGGITPVSARLGIGNAWFVTFKEEEDTIRAFEHVQGKSFKVCVYVCVIVRYLVLCCGFVCLCFFACRLSLCGYVCEGGIIPVSARRDIGNTWFVTFKVEEDTIRAFEHVQGKSFKVCVCLYGVARCAIALCFCVRSLRALVCAHACESPGTILGGNS